MRHSLRIHLHMYITNMMYCNVRYVHGVCKLLRAKAQYLRSLL